MFGLHHIIQMEPCYICNTLPVTHKARSRNISSQAVFNSFLLPLFLVWTAEKVFGWDLEKNRCLGFPSPLPFSLCFLFKCTDTYTQIFLVGTQPHCPQTRCKDRVMSKGSGCRSLLFRPWQHIPVSLQGTAFVLNP